MTSGSFSKTRVGYAVGAGGEWMLSSNWSAKLEYLVLRFGLRNLRHRRSRKRHWSGAKPWYRHRCGCCRYFFAGPLQGQHRSRRCELPFQQPGGFAILIGKARLAKHRCVRRATFAIQVRSKSRKPPDIPRLADAPARRSRACLHPDRDQLLG